jgi:hypothetical protein
MSLLRSILLLALTLPAFAASFNPQEWLAGSGFRANRDSLMRYSADSLHMDIRSQHTFLSGEATIQFTGMKLESPEIDLDWNNQLVKAWTPDPLPEEICGGNLGLGDGQKLTEGRSSGLGQGSHTILAADDAFAPVDSLTIDSLATEEVGSSMTDTPIELAPRLLPWPLFQDGQQKLYGRRLSLNLKTRQGRILDGRMGEAGSYYGGITIKRVNEDEMHVKNAVFTTCDAGCPHYHFEANQLKMLLKDRVLAKDIFLCFGNVKTFYSPVAMFSLKHGRASGIILPSFGNTARQGRSLDHLGWYWAASDTWDTQFKMSYAENGPDWLFQNGTVYRFDAANRGRFSSSYNISETSNKIGWDLRWNHLSALTPYVSMRADMRMASSHDFYDDTSDNMTTRLTSQLNSSFTLSGRFPDQRISWTLSSRANQNLQANTMSGVLPAFSLNFPTWNPLQQLAEPDEGRPSALANWLSGTILQVSSSTETKFNMSDWNYGSALKKSGAQHRLSLSVPGKLGPLNLTPRISMREQWVNRDLQFYENAKGQLDTLRVGGLLARHLFDVSMGASTKFYGIARPKMGRLLALRHVMTPSLSLSWAPDFSKEAWGYVEEREWQDPEYRDEMIAPAPQHLRLDRFAESLYGSTPTSDRLSLGIRLEQLFQGKWKAKPRPLDDSLDRDDPFADDQEDVNRHDLLGLSSQTTYDFRKDEYRLADLRTTWRLSPLKNVSSIGPFSGLNMNISTVHSPYQTDPLTGDRINRYRWQDGGSSALPRLSSTRVSLSTRLSGKKSGSKKNQDDDQDDQNDEDRLDDEAIDRFAPVFGNQDLTIPWDINLSWSWSLNKSNPLNPTRNHFMNASASIRVSKNWKLSTGMHYDFESRTFASNSIRIYRDMHCWEGNFTWNPRGANPSYHLLIKVKSSMLQDLKWDKRKGRSGTVSTF